MEGGVGHDPCVTQDQAKPKLKSKTKPLYLETCRNDRINTIKNTDPFPTPNADHTRPHASPGAHPRLPTTCPHACTCTHARTHACTHRMLLLAAEGGLRGLWAWVWPHAEPLARSSAAEVGGAGRGERRLAHTQGLQLLAPAHVVWALGC